jgi:hypothetical protein
MSFSRVRIAPSRRPQQFSNWFRYCQEVEKKCHCGWSQTTEKPSGIFFQPVMNATTGPGLWGTCVEEAGAVEVRQHLTYLQCWPSHKCVSHPQMRNCQASLANAVQERMESKLSGNQLYSGESCRWDRTHGKPPSDHFPDMAMP